MLTLEQKADNFTLLVNQAASERSCIFFIDSGEGHELETDTLLLEDISGWLIPVAKQDEFSLTADRHDEKWDDYFVFAEWRKNSEDIKIDFKKYPIYV